MKPEDSYLKSQVDTVYNKQYSQELDILEGEMNELDTEMNIVAKKYFKLEDKIKDFEKRWNVNVDM